MAAKKKRKVWRISDIVRALARERGREPTYGHNGWSDAAYVIGECAPGRSAKAVMDLCPFSLPALFGLGRDPAPLARGVGAARALEIEAALVETARRLRVPMVDA